MLPAANISVVGQNADLPQIAVAPDGTTTAVWRRNNATDEIVQAATRPPGGSFGAAVDLSTTGRDASELQIAIAPDGAATAVWRRYDGAKFIVQSASTAQSSFLLQVVRGGSGTGTVTSSPAGISCGADCAENYLSFTKVVLTATPSPDSTFTGWSGAGCSGTGTCEVTLLDATSVSATFEVGRLGSLKITPKSKTAKPGKKVTFKVKVKVKNTGLGIVSNLKVCAKAPTKLVKPVRCAKAGSLGAGKTRTVKIVATVKKGAKTGKKAKLTLQQPPPGSARRPAVLRSG